MAIYSSFERIRLGTDHNCNNTYDKIYDKTWNIRSYNKTLMRAANAVQHLHGCVLKLQ